MSDERPAFSRSNSNGEMTTELRGDTPKWILDVFDALVCASPTKTTRIALVNEVLAIYVQQKINEANVIQLRSRQAHVHQFSQH